MYINPNVVSFIDEHFIPVRIHVREQPELWKTVGERFGVQWTPTILVVDPGGTERHRIEGFLPAEDFLSQLTVGLAKSAFANARFTDAEKLFQTVVEKYPTAKRHLKRCTGPASRATKDRATLVRSPTPRAGFANVTNRAVGLRKHRSGEADRLHSARILSR